MRILLLVAILTSILTSILTALVTVVGCGDGTGPEVDYAHWRPLLVAELTGAAGDRPDDLYKFLHQGVMGPAHAVPDADHALGWLQGEWSETRSLAPQHRPPLLLPLRPDGRLVRLDLVRLRQLVGGAETAALDTLAAAFARTAQTWSRQPAQLAALWSAVQADTALWCDHFAAIDLDYLDRELGDSWPAVHHSESYRNRLAPHYRVVDPTLLPATWRQAGATP